MLLFIFTSGNSPFWYTIKRDVFPVAPSPTTTIFFRITRRMSWDYSKRREQKKKIKERERKKERKREEKKNGREKKVVKKNRTYWVLRWWLLLESVCCWQLWYVHRRMANLFWVKNGFSYWLDDCTQHPTVIRCTCLKWIGFLLFVFISELNWKLLMYRYLYSFVLFSFLFYDTSF